MSYLKQLLKALQDIATNLKANQELEKKLHEHLFDTTWRLTVSSAGYISTGSKEWETVISSNLVEDSRDTGVMMDRKKAVKIVTINGKAEKTETFTREASLSKEEKTHYKKYGIVLIVENV